MILFATLCAPAARAQQQPAPATVAGPSLYFDVEVTDHSGHPVTGLHAGDFTVLDNRNPSSVQWFNVHENANAQADSATIVIDDANLNFLPLSEERSRIEAFLRSGGGNLPVPISIYVVTQMHLTQIAEASKNGNQLADEFKQWEGHLSEVPWNADWGEIERWQSSIESLDRLISSAGNQPGRKLLIWITPGWPLFVSGNVLTTDKQLQWLMQTVVHFSTRLRDDSVTLDMVDPLGAEGGGGLTASWWQSHLKPIRKWQQAQPGSLSLQVLATQSGGQVLYKANDLAGALSRCIQDGSAWYTLGIVPQKAAVPDEWHGLEIKTDKPDATVRTRNGYYAEP